MDSIVDGEGIRMAIFFQGCPHHCKGCHNPETWDYNLVCNQYSVSDLLEVFDSDSILSGITLSGGEPMSPQNFDDLLLLCKAIKERGKNIWVFTGYILEDLIVKYPFVKEYLLPLIDVIVDGPFILEERNLLNRFKGSNNQRLIDVKKFLNQEVDFTFE